MALRFQQKLIVPTSARPLIERPHVLALLDRAIRSKRVVALAAPAGWGKTTVLAQWVAQHTMPAAWYTLDSTDRDPQVFLDYLLHSVADLAPGSAHIAARLADATPQELAEISQQVALALADAPDHFALILDDVHVLDDDQSRPIPGVSLVLALLASIAEYATKCHLVLASRTLPALHGMVRMVAQQRAAVFDYNVLQFQRTDTQQLAGVAAGLTLSDEAADQLTAAVGGWVTGIVLSLDQPLVNEDWTADQHQRLTAIATQRDAIIEANTSQVYAYFAEQILAPLPTDLQRFLEETSVLHDLSPHRCDILRSATNSATYLDEIKRRGLFISSRAGWISYHSLFRDYLLSRLARDPQRYRTLLRAAGDLYAAEEDIERALDCYLAAGDDQKALDLLRLAVPRLRQRSRQTTLLACFERLHHTQLTGDRQHSDNLPIRSAHVPQVSFPPDLLLAEARVYSDLALWERAYLALQIAEATGDDLVRAEAQILLAEVQTLQGEHVRAQQTLRAIDVAVLDDRLHLEYALAAGRAHIMAGEISAAITEFEHARAVATTSSDARDRPALLADIYDNLGWAYASQNNRPAAIRCLKRADACWQASGNQGRRALTLNNMGVIAMEEGRYAEARNAFESGLAIARQTRLRREETVLLCSRAELNMREGDLEQSINSYTEAHALAVNFDMTNNAEAAAAGAFWAALLAGNLAVARAWHDVTATIDAPSQPEVRGRLALARAMLTMQQRQPDTAHLSRLAAEATACELSLSEEDRAYAALLQAEIFFAQSGWRRAVEAWERFELYAGGLSPPILHRFAMVHRRLFEAAAPHSSLAAHTMAAFERSAPARWKITALGGFECVVDGKPVELSQLHRALLIRLLDAGPHGLSVERLWEAVWGNSDLSMPALHQALRRLRMQTGLTASAREGSVAIRSGWESIEYDVRELERALETPTHYDAIQRATTLYRGEFLPSAPISAGLWVEARRAHLQQRYLDAIEQYAQSLENDSPQQAMFYYQHILQIDGCREHTAAQLMRLAARYGNRSLVNATFEHLKGSLRALGTTPEPAIAALYQQLT
ncbi:transcriptional regulator [Roseiflexus sp.]|uniref:transcriptional regulator n=1 Tax=Roseiflexus sp. TaxID=2562120 RepID=UPI00398AC899